MADKKLEMSLDSNKMPPLPGSFDCDFFRAYDKCLNEDYSVRCVLANLPDRQILKNTILSTISKIYSDKNLRILDIGVNAYNGWIPFWPQWHADNVNITLDQVDIECWPKHLGLLHNLQYPRVAGTFFSCNINEFKAEAPYDIIIANGVINYGLNTPWQIKSFFSNMKLLLKPNGTIIVGIRADLDTVPIDAVSRHSLVPVSSPLLGNRFALESGSNNSHTYLSFSRISSESVSAVDTPFWSPYLCLLPLTTERTIGLRMLSEIYEVPGNIESVNLCPICGSSCSLELTARDLYGLQIQHKACLSCFTIYQSSRLRESLMHDVYRTIYTDIDRGRRPDQTDFTRELRKAHRIINNCLKVLDPREEPFFIFVGSGFGGCSRFASALGYSSTSVDLRTPVFKSARLPFAARPPKIEEYLTCKFSKNTVEAIFSSIMSDSVSWKPIIIYDQVFEHLYSIHEELDLLHSVADLYNALLYIDCPVYDSYHERYPSLRFLLEFPRTVLLNEASLTSLLNCDGFKTCYNELGVRIAEPTLPLKPKGCSVSQREAFKYLNHLTELK